MRWWIANETGRAELTITNVISNRREWNNGFIKFGTLVYLKIIARFYRSWCGKNNVVEWKIWKPRTRVCWKKITIIYNLRKAYQTKDIQPWSESLKSVQVWVIEKSYNCALAHCSCKNTVENFDGHVHDRRCLGQSCFPQEFYQRSLKLAVTALASVRAGCVELIAGQFRSPRQKIS